jgi:DedD protein
MFRWILLSGALVCSGASTVNAQAPSRPTDPVFVRAQALVSDGNGAAGRALIDSVIAATPPMAPLYPQALFWRASLAASAADAESDYKHIVVDYPLAPQAADALLRLAQLELARGDRDGALAHLQRIPRDYPRSKLLARTSYWTARVLFEKNDISNACAANAAALGQTDTTEIELRNQIQYQGQRCPTPTVANTSASVSPGSNPIPSVASPPPVPSSSTVSPSSTGPAASSTPVRVLPESTLQSRPKPPGQANDAKPSIVDPSKAPKRAVEDPASNSGKTTSIEKSASESAVEKPASRNPSIGATNGYSVQVAAYNHKPEADKLVSALKSRGYSARVDGSVAPFRVRIGRYTTEKDAEDALKRIKAKHMEGFVVRAPER